MCSALNKPNIVPALPKLAWKTDVKFTSPINYDECYGQDSTGCTSNAQRERDLTSPPGGQEQVREHLC